MDKTQIDISKKQKVLNEKGIGGWLLFFIITLVLNVLITAYTAFSESNILINLPTLLAKFPELIPKLYMFLPIEIILLLAIVVLGICAIFSLLTIHHSAVKIAKYFLYALPCLSIAVVIGEFWIYGGTPLSSVISAAVLQIITSSIYAGIWLTYLGRSTRVKATYQQT